MNTRDRISLLQRALWNLRDARDLAADALGDGDVTERTIQHAYDLVEVELDELANKMQSGE